MAHIIVESDATNSAAGSDDGASGPFVFSVETIDLLALLSFGYAEPFGSQHQLTRFVRRLRQHHDIDVTPLMTFYDRDVTDAEDLANLEAAWQSAAPLAGTLRATLSALQDDQEIAGWLRPACCPATGAGVDGGLGRRPRCSDPLVVLHAAHFRRPSRGTNAEAVVPR